MIEPVDKALEDLRIRSSVAEPPNTSISIPTGQANQRKPRRKMTPAEKIEYRKRRELRACKQCAVRRRKVSVSDRILCHSKVDSASVITANQTRSRLEAASAGPRYSLSPLHIEFKYLRATIPHLVASRLPLPYCRKIHKKTENGYDSRTKQSRKSEYIPRLPSFLA